MQLRNQLLLVLRPRLPRLKQLGHVIPDRRPPLRHLRRMHRMRSKGLNAVRMILFDTWEYDTGYVTNASSTWTDPTYQATQLARMERSVDYASSNGLYECRCLLWLYCCMWHLCSAARTQRQQLGSNKNSNKNMNTNMNRSWSRIMAGMDSEHVLSMWIFRMKAWL